MGRKRRLIFLLSIFLFLNANLFGQTIRYVKEGGSGTKDGTSWSNASDDLQLMINNSGASDLIFVAKGIYKPNRRANALTIVTPGDKNNAFVLKADVKIYGGFTADESAPNQRNLTDLNNISTLSVDFLDDDVLTGSGTTLSMDRKGENAFHVVISSGNVGGALLDGFKITGGYGLSGNAILVNGNNIRTVHGNGIACYNSSPTFNNIIVEANTNWISTGSPLGTGMYNSQSNPVLNNVFFIHNATTAHNGNSYGGGMHNDNSSPILNRVKFIGNLVNSYVSSGWGAAMSNMGTSSPKLFNVEFIGNAAKSEFYSAGGGAIYAVSSSSTRLELTNVLFTGNTTSRRAGGAILVETYNKALPISLILTNVTMSDNDGSIVSSCPVEGAYNIINIRNSIITNSMATSAIDRITINHSLIKDGYVGTGNIDADPLFVDATNGNYSLRRSSPAIGAGSNTYFSNGQNPDLTTVNLDLASNKRISGDRIDMGAYEWQFMENGLHFDGINDVATVPASGWLDHPELTLEAWIKPERLNGNNQTIIASRTELNTRFSLLINNHNITLWNGNGTSSVNTPQPFAANRWYHIALVLKNGASEVYLNGQFIGSLTEGMGTATNQPFQIGAGTPSGTYENFKGSIDEVRIWRGQRTAAEIAANFDSRIENLSDQPDLLAYWEFDEGRSAVDNTTVDHLVNGTNENIVAQVVNMARIGNSSNWLEGYAMVIPTSLVVKRSTADGFIVEWEAPKINDVEQYAIEVALDDQFSQLVDGSPFYTTDVKKTIEGVAPNTMYYVRVSADKTSVAGQGAYTQVQSISTSAAVMPPGDALSFNGIDNYVSLGNSNILKPTGQLSVGIWVNRANWDVAAFSAIISNTQGGGYSINISNAEISAAGKYIAVLVRRNTGYLNLKFEASKLTSGWHYIAFTYNGRQATLYVDGLEVDGIDGGSIVPIGYHATNSTLIGAEAGSADIPSGVYFKGSLDELRIYNTALTAEEVKTDMLNMSGVHTPNLVGHYRFDKNPARSNTELFDYSLNANDGTLNRFTFASSASNWVESYAMVMPNAKAASDISLNSFKANWDAPTLGLVDNGYVLDVATDDSFITSVVGSPFLLNALSKEITGLTAGLTYHYRVRADKASVTKQGAPSQTVSVTLPKIAQTIGFSSLVNKTYGDANFNLVATGGASGNAITYNSSNPLVATITGSTVTIVGVGTTTITASQLGNASYLDATSVQQTLVVNKAAQAISFSSLANKTYGDADFNLDATGGASGNALAYNSSNPLVATVTGSTVTIVGVGTTTITASQLGNASYLDAASVQQTLTVNKAAQNISFASLANKTYGDANFNLSATGGASGNALAYTSSNPLVATVSGSTVVIVGAGSATITASQLGNGNYLDAPNVQQNLTVYKAGQSITFNTLDAKTTTSQDFILTANSSSGLEVSFSSSNTNVAEVYQNGVVWMVKIKGEGLANITATQVGNDNYLTAPAQVQQLLVVEAPLPVNLISYKVTAEGTAAKLEWRTASEQNNKGFEIYRSGNDKQFVKLGQVIARGTGSTYSYYDKSPLNGNNYYRLVQIDLDGKPTALGERVLNFEFTDLNVQLYPNPSKGKVRVTFAAAKYNRLALSSVDGKVLNTIPINSKDYEIEIELDLYPVGLYFVKLIGESESITKKVIKQ